MHKINCSEKMPTDRSKTYFVYDKKGRKGVAILADPKMFYDGKKRTWLWSGDFYKDDVITYVEE